MISFAEIQVAVDLVLHIWRDQHRFVRALLPSQPPGAIPGLSLARPEILHCRGNSIRHQVGGLRDFDVENGNLH